MATPQHSTYEPFHCKRRIRPKVGNFQNLSQTKPKGVTTQMKALDEYILIILSVLSLKINIFFLHFLKLIWMNKFRGLVVDEDIDRQNSSYVKH